MNRTIRATTAGLLVLGVIAGGIAAQPAERAIEERLIAFTQQLRMGLTLATVAAYSPTIGDLRLHTQQLVNLLEGSQGRHYVRPVRAEGEISGLLVDVAALAVRLEAPSIELRSRGVIADAVENVRTYLLFALDSSLAALEERRIDRASTEMLRTYAFLLAAYEKPCDPAYVPALWTILRELGLAEPVTGEDDQA